MADSVESIAADIDAIRGDLAYFTRRWHELDEPCWMELRAFDENGRAQIQKFRTDPDWIEEAARWASVMNARGRNIYAVRNPIRDACTGSASDSDILAAFYLWADCDEPSATDNVLRFQEWKATAIVRTGRTPHTRAHFYFELEEPVYNLDAWRARQQAIAAAFGSDRQVVNPSRIMRVAGTVAWPAEHKRRKGYIAELTALRTEFPDDREPISFERAMQVWPDAPASAPQSAADGFSLDAGPAPLDRERARIQALSGEEWHNAVIRLVGSYVSKGLSDAEIHGLTDALTLDGYTVEQTRHEVQAAIDGARRKGWTPEAPQPHTNFDFKPANEFADEPDAMPEAWRIQSAAEFTADFTAPEWLVEGIIQRGRLYTLTAPTGHAKTALTLYIGAQISQGGQVCGLETEQGDVLILAGENPDDVRARVIVALDKYGIDPATCRLHFVPGTFSIRQDMERLREAASHFPDLALIVVDTFAAYFDGDDENSNAQALDFARVVRQLTALPSRPAVVMPAHPIKNAGKGNLTPKGGSSLLNEVDGNLTAWKDENIATLHWQGKIRGPDFEPIKAEIRVETHPKVHDKRGVLMPSVVALPVLELRAKALAQESMSREDAVLMSIDKWPGMSTRDRCVEVGLVGDDGAARTGPMSRIMDRLSKAKLIRKKHREWVLTSDGEDAVAAIKAGQVGEEDIE